MSYPFQQCFTNVTDCLWHHIKIINSINIVLLTAVTQQVLLQKLDCDDYEVRKLEDFRGPSTSNSKTFTALLCFQGLSRC